MGWRVALTFDAEHPDRPHPAGGTDRVLALLAEARVPASFFIQGRWAEGFPSVARAVADGGHLIGNHSHYHARMPLLRPAGLARDIRAAERAILRMTGVDPRPWFRCPFGAGTHDPTIEAELARLGYREVRWDIDGADWRRRLTGRALASTVIRQVATHGDGAVVLLHPWTTATRDGLEAIITGLAAAGADFVRVDDLDALPSGAA